ncbi:aldo/keto reductase [Curtobacterium sp. RRHDQ66]|uniref:aldo/keto reductase n=1 Tax=Curtobacterium guangdongense TaxID=3413380 RepID=UPI003BEFDF20
MAEARNVPMAQIAMAWVVSNPVVSAPIIGATKPHHLDDAAAAVDIDLTPDEVTALGEHYQARPAGGL